MLHAVYTVKGEYKVGHIQSYLVNNFDVVLILHLVKATKSCSDTIHESWLEVGDK